MKDIKVLQFNNETAAEADEMTKQSQTTFHHHHTL
jgi:hypothetical protein